MNGSALIVRSAARTLVIAGLLAAAGLPAAAAAARPDVDVKLDQGKPNPDGSGDDYKIEFKIKRKDGEYKVPVTIPGGGCTAKKKGELISAAINNQLGAGSCTQNNGTIGIKGDSEHAVESVERKKDGTGEKDTIKGVAMGAFAMGFGLGVNEGTWVATGTRYADDNSIVPGSWLTVGVAGQFETTVDVQTGMTVSDVIALAYDSLKNSAAPDQFRNALTMTDGLMSFDGAAAGYDESWEYTIQSTDLGLQGGEFFSVGLQSVPTPGTMALLALGGLCAARRRR
jgi:MYXO-CTERM domain-containing protein